MLIDEILAALKADPPFRGEACLPLCCPALLCACGNHSGEAEHRFRDRPETVRLHPGTGVHLHPGILFGIIPEHRSESSRNRVHLAPDSPLWRWGHGERWDSAVVKGNTLRRNSRKPLRPYIWRFRSLRRWTCPSTCPLLQCCSTAAETAS
jgi:hypothetical protein